MTIECKLGSGMPMTQTRPGSQRPNGKANHIDYMKLPFASHVNSVANSMHDLMSNCCFGHHQVGKRVQVSENESGRPSMLPTTLRREGHTTTAQNPVLQSDRKYKRQLSKHGSTTGARAPPPRWVGLLVDTGH
jgi:hypothetical protein